MGSYQSSGLGVGVGGGLVYEVPGSRLVGTCHSMWISIQERG